MFSTRLFGRLFVLAALCWSVLLPTQAQAQFFTKDLGTLGGQSSGCNGLNNAGQAVGVSFLPGGLPNHAFLWTPGGTDGVSNNPQMKDLGVLGTNPSDYSEANGINDAGQVVGGSSNGDLHAFLWTPGGTDGVSNNLQMKDLGTLGGLRSEATGINALEQVVGWAFTSTPEAHAFLWIRGATDGVAGNPQMKDLGTLGGTDSRATAINRAGQVVGYSKLPDGTTHAFLWTPGGTDGVPGNPQMKDLGALSGLSSYAYGINGSGQVVGYLEQPDGTQSCFLWTSSGTEGIPGYPQTKDLGGLGSLLSTATGINSAGVLTGGTANIVNNGVVIAALIWTPDVPNGTTGTVTASGISLGGSTAIAYGINDSGVIAGSSTLTGDPTDLSGSPIHHAFVRVPNTKPNASSQTVASDEDVAVAITLSATDPDGSPIASYQIVGQPTHGILVGTAPNLFYIPSHDYNGQDSFTFRASDGTSYSDPATVTINVNPVNDAPVAFGTAYATHEDTAIAIGLPAGDVDGDALNYSIVSGPSHGTLSGSGNSRVYTPSPNFVGADSFTFKANDGQADSNVATVSITVLAVNHAPVASDQSVSTNQDTAKAITLSASDVDSDNLTYSIVSGPTHGTLTGTGASRTYTPFPNFVGADSFTFKANDGQADSNIATVSITVNHVNHLPVAVNDTATTKKNTAITINVLGNDSDVDGDALTVAFLTQPANGTAAISANKVVFTPKNAFIGTTTFTYTVSDGHGGTATATVTVTVTK